MLLLEPKPFLLLAPVLEPLLLVLVQELLASVLLPLERLPS
ncbi:MAG: hypothetical protein V4723_18605 [Pseudomonadota bacterium]